MYFQHWLFFLGVWAGLIIWNKILEFVTFSLVDRTGLNTIYNAKIVNIHNPNLGGNVIQMGLELLAMVESVFTEIYDLAAFESPAWQGGLVFVRWFMFGCLGMALLITVGFET